MYRLWDYLWGTTIVEKPVIKFIVNPDELLKVKLRPIDYTKSVKKIKKPALARNLPCAIEKFHLLKLNKNQINEILSVKLKKTVTQKRKTSWDLRHPVLRELLQKTTVY